MRKYSVRRLVVSRPEATALGVAELVRNVAVVELEAFIFEQSAQVFERRVIFG